MKNTKSLATTHPHLAKEWDYEKNGNITPDAIIAGSAYEAHWICSKNKEHKWAKQIRYRARCGAGVKGGGCPKCNCLATTHPYLVEEWDYEKNGSLIPENFTCGSNQNAYWICKKNKDHKWVAKIWKRSMSGSKCPHCNRENRKIIVKNVCLATTYPHLAREWDYEKNGKVTPENITFGSKYRAHWIGVAGKNKGFKWTAVVKERVRAYKHLKKRTCLAITHPHLLKDWDYEKNIDVAIPEEVASGSSRKVHWKCIHGHEWMSKIIERTQGFGGCPRCSSLSATHPHLAREWDCEKNGKTTPYKIRAGSRYNAYWICNKGHAWTARINQRTRGESNCPHCHKEKLKIFILATAHPYLVTEWDYEKNGKITPENVFSGSAYKAHWICSKNKEHKWISTVSSRSHGSGCPKCRKIILEDGEEYDSLCEAYFALLFKGNGVIFRHNKPYPGIKKIYDFYIIEKNEYVEVTSFSESKDNKIWKDYIKNIKFKRHYVENILRAKFSFYQKRLSDNERAYVRKNSK